MTVRLSQEGEEAAPPSALLHGHSGAVSGVAVTPDGRLISVDSQGSVIVWRSRAGSPRHGDSSAQRHTAAHAARHGSPAIAVIHPLALPDRVMPEGRDDGGFQTPAETLFEPSNQQSDGSGERGLRELQPSSLPGGMLCRSPTVDACPLQPAAWSEQRQGGSATHELGSPPRRGSTVSRQLLWSGSTIQRVPPAETRLPPAGDLQPSLDSLIGCSRGPGSALVWRPETGFLAYAAANSVIIDDVSTGRQRYENLVCIKMLSTFIYFYYYVGLSCARQLANMLLFDIRRHGKACCIFLACRTEYNTCKTDVMGA